MTTAKVWTAPTGDQYVLHPRYEEPLWQPQAPAPEASGCPHVASDQRHIRDNGATATGAIDWCARCGSIRVTVWPQEEAGWQHPRGTTEETLGMSSL